MKCKKFGDFEVPEIICQHVKRARENGRLTNSSIPTAKNLFEDAKKIFEMMKEKTKLNIRVLHSIVGGFWCEISWAFANKKAQVNKQERDAVEKKDGEQTTTQTQQTTTPATPATTPATPAAPGTATMTTDDKKSSSPVNNHVVKGTTGAGCGEGWFGLTFWNQKKIIINELKRLGKLNGFNISLDESKYLEGDMLADLPDETWCLITEIYIKKICPKRFAELLLPDDCKNVDQEHAIYASFLFKAGCGHEISQKGVNKAVQGYINTHEKQNKPNNPNYKAKDGFATQIYAAIMLALYMSTDKIPTIEEVDSKLGITKH